MNLYQNSSSRSSPAQIPNHLQIEFHVCPFIMHLTNPPMTNGNNTTAIISYRPYCHRYHHHCCTITALQPRQLRVPPLSSLKYIATAFYPQNQHHHHQYHHHPTIMMLSVQHHKVQQCHPTPIIAQLYDFQHRGADEVGGCSKPIGKDSHLLDERRLSAF